MHHKKPFYFIRHGQTDWNKNNLRMGQKDIPLNEIGIAQAQEMQKLITSLNFSHIFYSPLQRTVQTMLIATAHLNCNKVMLNELKEWNFGDWEGKPSGKSVTHDIYAIVPPQGETTQVFFDRIGSALNHVLTHDEPILIIAHGGTYYAICHYLNLPIKPIHNCQLVQFAPPTDIDNKWRQNIL